MKYFTHELVEKYGSEDDRIADEAEAEWELTSDAYLKHLQEISPKFPKSVQSFLSEFCLHDARLVNLMANEPWFSLLFQLGIPRTNGKLALKNGHGRHGGVLLSYEVPEMVQVIYHPVDQQMGIQLEWLYDEIDVVQSGEEKLFTHSILMTAGLELHIPFRELRVESYTGVAAGRSVEPQTVKELPMVKEYPMVA